MPKYGNSAPTPLKIEHFKNIHRHYKRFTNTLPRSLQPLSVDELKPRYVQKRILGHKCPNMVTWPYLAPDILPKLKILKHVSVTRWVLPIPFQRALNRYQIDNFKPRYIQKWVLGPKCSNMVIWPQTPWKLKFLTISTITRSVLLIGFQRAFDHYL